MATTASIINAMTGSLASGTQLPASVLRSSLSTIINDLADVLNPPGTPVPLLSTVIPEGYGFFDGVPLSSALYPKLSAAWLSTFGGSGGNFNVPSIPEGTSLVQMGNGSYILGAMGGSKTHTLTNAEVPDHNHTQNAHNHTQDSHNHTQNSHNHTQDAHSHTTQIYGTNASDGSYAGTTPGTNNQVANTYTPAQTSNSVTATNQAATATNQAATATNQVATATNNATTGGGGAHNNMPPYIAVKWIFRLC